MKIIQTDKIKPDDLKPAEREWVYNGLDCCVTAEVLDVLLEQLDNVSAATYAHSRSLQGPVLEMRLRGILVDKARRAEVIEEHYEKLDRLERQLHRLASEGCDFGGFNWASPKDCAHLFYSVLGIPEIRKRKTGAITVDRDALEKLEAYVIARPIVNHIVAIREIKKRIDVLKTPLDSDGRYRTSFNIAGTSTFRFSSSLSEFGTGGNAQNIEEFLRSMFIADKDMKMAYLDAEQIQSRIVGGIEWNLFKDGRYLDACESGDLHTVVARLCWPNLPWSGNLQHDKDVAETPYYRHYTYRFMCKKIGHGTNFRGKPPTIAAQAKVDIDVIKQFQPKYFSAFPSHELMHEWIEREIFENGVITSITGERRHFWGRRDSDDTVREAIAYGPQASEAKIVNSGMLNVWRARDCQLLLQNHDAIVVQYPEEREDEIVPKIIEQLRFPVELLHGRQLVIPYGCKTGWNFGEFNEKNPDGLKKYKPGDKRRRTPAKHILDRSVRSVH